MMRRGTFIVLACALGACASESQSSTKASVSSGSLFGINMPADGSHADVASDIGARWVRIELVDGSPGGDLAPQVAARLDATLADYHARGISVLLLVDYGTLGGNAGFGDGQACGDWNGWRGAWLDRVSRVAQRFGDRVDAWEIWNEPDQPMLSCGSEDYNPGMPSSEYGPLLRDAYVTLRDGGAQGPIITGGLDSGQVSYILDGAAAAGGLWADGVSIHTYGVVPDSSWCPDPGEDLNCEWGTLGGKVDEYGGATGLPVWITEFGVKTRDTQHQAAFLAGAYAAFASRGAAVATAFAFCGSDAMVPPFGLTFDDWSPKSDAYATYQALTADAPPPPPPPGTTTSNLHGTVEAGGAGIAGLWVSAWGKNGGDFHGTYTDALGIYQFTDLDPASRYNVVVNAVFDPSVPGGFAVVDGSHAFDVHDDIELISGPDGWHGDNFSLPF